MSNYFIALDQGTTSSRTVIFDEYGSIASQSQKEFTQIFPQPGWVEHDPEEIWQSQLFTLEKALTEVNDANAQFKCIGITNQRETTVVWNKTTGIPIYNAIVWQDRRTAPYCEQLKTNGLENYIRSNTGLVADAYFSGTKIKWLLENVAGAKKEAQKGNLLFGTIDTWLIWKLTNGKVHATDFTNASRTLIFNIRSKAWDKTMIDELGILENMLPEVKSSAEIFGHWEYKGNVIPISGVAGDQQAALFGQRCISEGMVKNTYGTGCFMLMYTGNHQINSKYGLLTTLAADENGKPAYALEGSVFIAGAAVQWLRDGIKIINNAADSEQIALTVPNSGGVVVVPAFTGLGTPYWDMYARGAIFGITRDTTEAHIVRATLESIAYQTKDILDAMVSDSGISIKSLQVDGGGSRNNLLMQFQADILEVQVNRSSMIESTAFGAMLLAIKGIGLDINNLKGNIFTSFNPKMDNQTRTLLYKKWHKAVERVKNWED
ncbi:MAG: glycerol kinase GlpK [Bacteroidota bacterium]|nr:glycerol kinase GlpK [Bacteroidota bacterium]